MLTPLARELLSRPNFAALSTLLPDGTPQTHLMWVDADDEGNVLLNTEIHRQKFANVRRDPRVTVLVFDVANPYHFVEIRGRVTATIGGAEARAHIDTLARKYTGKDYAQPVTSERVMLKVEPRRVVEH